MDEGALQVGGHKTGAPDNGISLAQLQTTMQSRLRTSGWMLKKGSSRTGQSWKKRWFVLDGFVLRYYRSPEDNRPRGHIALAGAELYTAVHETYGSRYMEIHVPAWRLKYPLAAVDQVEYVQWLQTMIYVINLALETNVPMGEDGQGNIVGPLANTDDKEEVRPATLDVDTAAVQPGSHALSPPHHVQKGPTTGQQSSHVPSQLVEMLSPQGDFPFSPGIAMRGGADASAVASPAAGPLVQRNGCQAPVVAPVIAESLEVGAPHLGASVASGSALLRASSVESMGSQVGARENARRTLAAMISAAAASAAEGERTKMAVADVTSAWTLDENEGWLQTHLPSAASSALLAGAATLRNGALPDFKASHLSPQFGVSRSHMTEALACLLNLPLPTPGTADRTAAPKPVAPASTKNISMLESTDFAPFTVESLMAAGLPPPPPPPVLSGGGKWKSKAVLPEAEAQEAPSAPATSVQRALVLADSGVQCEPMARTSVQRALVLADSGVQCEPMARMVDEGVQANERIDVQMQPVSASASAVDMSCQTVDGGLPMDHSTGMRNGGRLIIESDGGMQPDDKPWDDPWTLRSAAAMTSPKRTFWPAIVVEDAGEAVSSLGLPVAPNAVAATTALNGTQQQQPLFSHLPKGQVIGFRSDPDAPAHAQAYARVHSAAAAPEPYASASSDMAHAKAAAAPPVIAVRQTRTAQVRAATGAARRASIEASEAKAASDGAGMGVFIARPAPPPHTVTGVTAGRKVCPTRWSGLPTVEVSLHEPAPPPVPVRSVPAPSLAALAAAATQLALAMRYVQEEYAYHDLSAAISAINREAKAVFSMYAGRPVEGEEVNIFPSMSLTTTLALPQLQALSVDAGLTEGSDEPDNAPLSTAHIEAIYQRLAAFPAPAPSAAVLVQRSRPRLSSPSLFTGLTYTQFVSGLLMAAVLAYGPTQAEAQADGSAASPLRKLHRRHLLPLVTTGKPVNAGGIGRGHSSRVLAVSSAHIERLFAVSRPKPEPVHAGTSVAVDDGEDSTVHDVQLSALEQATDWAGTGSGSGSFQPLAAAGAPALETEQSVEQEHATTTSLLTDLADRIADIIQPDVLRQVELPPAPDHPVPSRPCGGSGSSGSSDPWAAGSPSPSSPLLIAELGQAGQGQQGGSPFPSAARGTMGASGSEALERRWSPSSPLQTRVPGLRKSAGRALHSRGTGSMGPASLPIPTSLPRSSPGVSVNQHDYSPTYHVRGHTPEAASPTPTAPRNVLTTTSTQGMPIAALRPTTLVPERYLRLLSGGRPSAAAIPSVRAVLHADAKPLAMVFTHYAELRAASLPTAARMKGMAEGGYLKPLKHASSGLYAQGEGWQAQARSIVSTLPVSSLMDRSAWLLSDILRFGHEFGIVPSLVSNAGLHNTFFTVATPQPGVLTSEGGPVAVLHHAGFVELIGRIALAAYALQGPLLEPGAATLLLLQWMDKSRGRELMMRESRGAASVRFGARTAFK